MIKCRVCGTNWCMCNGLVRCPECGKINEPDGTSPTIVTNKFPWLKAQQRQNQQPQPQP